MTVEVRVHHVTLIPHFDVYEDGEHVDTVTATRQDGRPVSVDVASGAWRKGGGVEKVEALRAEIEAQMNATQDPTV